MSNKDSRNISIKVYIHMAQLNSTPSMKQWHEWQKRDLTALIVIFMVIVCVTSRLHLYWKRRLFQVNLETLSVHLAHLSRSASKYGVLYGSHRCTPSKNEQLRLVHFFLINIFMMDYDLNPMSWVKSHIWIPWCERDLVILVMFEKN